MHKGFLIFSLLISVLFAIEKPDGGYATWEDFEKGIPTYDISNFRIEPVKVKKETFPESGKRIKIHIPDWRVLIFLNSEEADSLWWEENLHGPLTIIKKQEKIYFFKPDKKVLSPKQIKKKIRKGEKFKYHSIRLHYYQNYSWFGFQVRTTDYTYGPTIIRGSDPKILFTSIAIIDMSTKEIIPINKLRLPILLQETPNILRGWDNEHNLDKRINPIIKLNYLEDFLEKTNKKK